MERYVLDTSLFTNPDVFAQFAADASEALRVFLELAARTPAEFYMPVSVYDELGRMKDLAGLAPVFEATVRIRSPRRSRMTLPSEILYEFIEEVRTRIDRGLRIAEEHLRLAGQAEAGKDPSALVAKLRERYREALRKGIVDSKEDVDVLLLAYELDAVLVSGDQGLLRWADKVGVKLVNPAHLRRILEALADGRSPSGG